MAKFLTSLHTFVLLSVILFMSGCSSPKKSPSTQGTILPGKGATLVADPRTPSSLEAMKKGLASVTPPSSPLKDILFDFDNSDLRADAREVLKASAEWLDANPAVQIEIEGHTDDWGPSEYNLVLGSKRAQIAKEYLVTLGIQPERLKMVSYGEEAPACLEQIEECRQKNRRARFVILTVIPSS
jgi:peptidoglycan-associated lipoprotein